MFDLEMWEETQIQIPELKLRDYQEKLVSGCRKAMSAGHKRVVAYLPTGGGKTSVAIAMVKSALDRGNKVAFVCNRIQLIQQTSDVFNYYGISHGILQGSNTKDIWKPVLVCSIDTIRARGGLPGEFNLVILDECHACPGTREYHSLMHGRYVIGLTATPYQKGMGMRVPKLDGELFQTIVAGATMRELQERGWLVFADVWGPSDPDLTGVKIVAGDYQEDQLGKAMNKAQLIGDIVDHWLRLANGKQTMAFCVNISHSKAICEAFKRAGVNSVHVDYRMDDNERREIYRAFRAGEFTVLCNCALLSEGADFPACEVLILARPTRSRVRYVQMFGRVLRPSLETGKDHAIVLDHSGTVKRLGFPWDFSVTHLDDGKPKKTSEQKDKEQPESLPNPCPKCSFLKPAKVHKCPSCGFEPQRPSTVETAEGQLVPLTAGTKCPKQKNLQSMGRASIYGQLCQWAKEHDKAQNWINANYKSIWDQWPRQDYHFEPVTPELASWIRSKQIAWAKSHRRTA